MKIVCISDTHMRHEDVKLPDGDILIHAGDATVLGSYRQILVFATWMSKQPHKIKLFVPGNHDFIFEREPEVAKSIVGRLGIHVLIGQQFKPAPGITFWGGPWVPTIGGWAFGRNPDRLEILWSAIPSNLDVLITHGPPWGILDCGIGDGMLLHRVSEVSPRFHIFGHVHGGYGRKVVGKTEFINCAIMDDQYELSHEPIVIDLE